MVGSIFGKILGIRSQKNSDNFNVCGNISVHRNFDICDIVWFQYFDRFRICENDVLNSCKNDRFDIYKDSTFNKRENGIFNICENLQILLKPRMMLKTARCSNSIFVKIY